MRLIVKLVNEIREDGLFDTAAGMAFWLLLSLPAALLAVLSSVSLLGDDVTRELREATLEFVDRVFASEADTLGEAVNSLFDQNRPGVLSASIATAVFTLSRGFAGLIRALDEVYDIEETRNFIHTRLLAIGLALGTLVIVAVTSALWSLGEDAGLPGFVLLLGAGAILVLWSATIFHLGPNHRTPWRYDLPGAGLAAVGWLALSLGFGWYVRLLGGGGNELIGAAGAVLLGLTWLWAACVVLLIGGEVNEIIADRAGVVRDRRSLITRFEAGRTATSQVSDLVDTVGRRVRRKIERGDGHQIDPDVDHEVVPDADRLAREDIGDDGRGIDHVVEDGIVPDAERRVPHDETDDHREAPPSLDERHSIRDE